MSEETEEIIEKVVALAPGLTMALYPQIRELYKGVVARSTSRIEDMGP